MSVKIRLRRTGKVNQPSHRIVVTDIRSPRNGTFIECIGYYDPRHKIEKVEVDRADFWIARGALPSETCAAIIKRARAGVVLGAAKAARVAAPAAESK